MNQTLAERIHAKIEELRPLLKEYELLPEDQKKGTRHMLYTLSGGFGKAIVPTFDQFRDLELKISLAKHENSSNK